MVLGVTAVKLEMERIRYTLRLGASGGTKRTHGWCLGIDDGDRHSQRGHDVSAILIGGGKCHHSFRGST